MHQNSHLTDFLFHNAKSTPNKPAIVFENETISWSELANKVESVASFLYEQVGSSNKQEIISILLPNNLDYVINYLAVLHLGHIALPIDVIFKPLEIDAILRQIPPAAIIVDQANRKRIKDKEYPILIAGEMDGGSLSSDNLLRLPVDKQIATLLFTSGTTGKPKATPYTHANHIWNIKASSQIWDWTSNDTILISLRLSHWHGLVMGLSGALYHGNTLYLHERFDPEKTLETLASGKISMFTHVGLVYFQLIQYKNAKKYDLSKVRLCISASSSLPPAVWHKFKQLYDAEILECYGSSEAGRVASNRLDDRRPGSIGKPLPGVEVKLSPKGEILVKTPGIFPGYYNNPEATKEALSPDGWWQMGDLGQIEDGRLILKGRVHERIKKYGYTIYPRDVEWALHQNHQIKESFVMGVPAADGQNDRLVYFVVTHLSKDEVVNFCKENMPSVWRPDEVVHLDTIPRTRSGKPELVKLKAMLDL